MKELQPQKQYVVLRVLLAKLAVCQSFLFRLLSGELQANANGGEILWSGNIDVLITLQINTALIPIPIFLRPLKKPVTLVKPFGRKFVFVENCKKKINLLKKLLMALFPIVIKVLVNKECLVYYWIND